MTAKMTQQEVNGYVPTVLKLYPMATQNPPLVATSKSPT